MLKKTMFATTFFSTGFVTGAITATGLFALGAVTMFRDTNQKSLTEPTVSTDQPIKNTVASLKDPAEKTATN